MIYIKGNDELVKMRKAAREVVDVLKRLRDEAKPGISTWELNKIAEDISDSSSYKAAFKGYADFPAAVCFALNNEIVHGIPSKKKILKEGDILGMDFGVYLDGYYGDSAITVPIGKVSESAKKLLEVTEASLNAGIEKALKDNYLYDISGSVQSHVEKNGFSVVRSFVGHGIGRNLHEEPQIPNFVPQNARGRGVKLRTGMVMAIEPMVNEGTPDVKILDDGWTAVTADGKLSAHFEHTIAITDNGPEILTIMN